VASGAAALILQQRPGITPDQVKALLTSTAAPIPGADPVAQGAGLLNLKAARDTPTPDAVQVWPQAGGGGQLEAARGSGHVADEGGIELAGEGDIFGHPWSPMEWVVSSWNESSWQGGSWNGNVWSGSGWTGQSWAHSTWEPVLWNAPTWSGQPWSEQAAGGRWWTGKTWAGEGWGGKSWGGKSWGGKSWGGKSWSSVSWG
jgi:serine protease AprX